MKFFIQSLLVIVFLCVNGFMDTSHAASNAVSPRGDLPLMVIRFNHSHIAYEKSLYDTIAEALKVAPNAKFEVVSVATQSSESDIQKQYDKIAQTNLARIKGTFKEMNFPLNRLSSSLIAEPIKYNEVRIYIH